MIYLIFSKNGWLGRNSQFTTDRTKAREHTRHEALEQCALFRENNMVTVPVRLEDLP